MRKLILLVTLPLFLLDLLTKQLIVWKFAAPPAPTDPSAPYWPIGYEGDLLIRVPVIEGFFDLVRVHNTGVAFGMANGSAWANTVFGTLTVGAMILIWWLVRSNAFPTKMNRVAVALLLSGIFGNLLDRIWRGYVVDFLHFYVGERSWPSFNVADSCICVAAGLLFLSAFQKTPAKK